MSQTTTTKRKISVIDRRLQGTSPFASGSVELPAKEPGKWVFRTVNSEVAPNRVWTVRNKLGWDYATPDDLAESPAELGLELRDGRLVMGIRGSEVVMKMLRTDWQRVQKAKSDYNTKTTFGAKQNKTAAVEQAGATLGSEAAEFLAKHLREPAITDSRGGEE